MSSLLIFLFSGSYFYKWRVNKIVSTRMHKFLKHSLFSLLGNSEILVQVELSWGGSKWTNYRVFSFWIWPLLGYQMQFEMGRTVCPLALQKYGWRACLLLGRNQQIKPPSLVKSPFSYSEPHYFIKSKFGLYFSWIWSCYGLNSTQYC